MAQSRLTKIQYLCKVLIRGVAGCSCPQHPGKETDKAMNHMMRDDEDYDDETAEEQENLPGGGDPD